MMIVCKSKIKRRIMVDDDFIYFLILNGYSQQNNGLMYGKMGTAISLFQLSRYLKDKKIEDHAYEMTNQVFASCVQCDSFDNGRIGLAWSLAYLINNQYAEIDYHEVYGKEHDIIMKTISCYIPNKDNIHQSFDYLIFLLTVVPNISRHSVGTKIVDKILATLCSYSEDIINDSIEEFYLISTKIIGISNICRFVNLDKCAEKIVSKFKEEYDNYVCNNLTFLVELLNYGIRCHTVNTVLLATDLIDTFFKNLLIVSIDYKTAVDILYNIKRLSKSLGINRYQNIKILIEELIYNKNSFLYQIDWKTLGSLKGGLTRFIWNEVGSIQNSAENIIMLL